MNNAQASRIVDEQVARLRELAGLVKAATPDVAEAVEAVFVEQIAAGTDATGRKWKPTQDGKQPMREARKALTIVPVGLRILCQLRGPEARHHRGIARGGIVRAIFPEKGLPPRLAAKIKATLTERFGAVTGA